MNSQKEGNNRRKEFRQSKEEQRSKPVLSKKDTKKWCRGKTGVEHKPKCFPYVSNPDDLDKKSGLHRWRLLICTECGKRLDYWFGNNKFKPEWVS